MSEIAEEIRKDIEYVNRWDREAGVRDFTTAEIKEVVAAQNRLKKSVPILLEENELLKQSKADVEHNRELLSKEKQELIEENERLTKERDEEKHHSELGWEQSGKWLEENGRLRAELDQVKKDGNDFEELYKQEHRDKNRLRTELAEKDKVLAEAHDIIDSIPKGGSKEGRPDYGTMVTSDKIHRLRSILSQYKKGDTKNA